MMRGRYFRLWLGCAAAALILGCATPAWANAIAPAVAFFPGMAALAWGAALPLSVAGAFLERPFFAAAGVREHALWYSLQANAVSLAIGFLSILVFPFGIYLLGPIWLLLAAATSILSEGWYVRKLQLTGEKPLRWRWIVFGNLFSSFVMLSVPIAVEVINSYRPAWRWEVEPYQDSLFWISMIPSAVVLWVSFFVPGIKERMVARRAAVSAEVPA